MLQWSIHGQFQIFILLTALVRVRKVILRSRITPPSLPSTRGGKSGYTICMPLPANIQERFSQALERGSLAHAYLFTGREGADMRGCLLELAGLVLKTPADRLTQNPDFYLQVREAD